MMVKLVLLLILWKVGIVLSQCRTNYSSMAQLIKEFAEDAFPINNITPGCVSQDCPSLSTISCPYFTNGSLNIDTLIHLISDIQSCLSQPGTTLCSTPIDPIPMCNVGISLQQWLNPSGINGTLAVIPGMANISGLSKLTLTPNLNTTSATSTSIYLNIPALLIKGQLQGQAGLVGWNLQLPIDNITCSATVNISQILMVNAQPNAQMFNVQITAKALTATANFGDLLGGENPPPLLADIQAVVNYAAQSSLQSSALPDVIGNFISSIINNALTTSVQKCKE